MKPSWTDEAAFLNLGTASRFDGAGSEETGLTKPYGTLIPCVASSLAPT